MLETGISYTSTVMVNDSNTATALGSGDLEVFATPMMVALMENAAMNAVRSLLDYGTTTVGAQINTSHIKASPMGAKISATATLTAIEGKKLTFAVVAKEEDTVIGEGVHVRFIVEIERFLNKFKK